MKNSTKIKLLTIALIACVLFLVVGVDYLPHLVCWMPLIITAYLALKCRAFVAHINRWLDRVIPID